MFHDFYEKSLQGWALIRLYVLHKPCFLFYFGKYDCKKWFVRCAVARIVRAELCGAAASPVR